MILQQFSARFSQAQQNTILRQLALQNTLEDLSFQADDVKKRRDEDTKIKYAFKVSLPL